MEHLRLRETGSLDRVAGQWECGSLSGAGFLGAGEESSGSSCILTGPTSQRDLGEPALYALLGQGWGDAKSLMVLDLRSSGEGLGSFLG